MNIIKKYMTKNDCYSAGRKITPAGIMLHSTATPGVMAADWFSRWNKSYKAGEINRQVCVHAFIDHKEIWQYLPWDHRGWHAGGSANNTHIGVEICEPEGFSYAGGAKMVGYDVAKNEPYFRAAWQNAVELCVMLCRMYGLTEKDIIDHSQGHKRGIASNNADVMHWFPKHGESMDTFRAAVKAALNEEVTINQDRYNVMMDKWQNQNNPFYATLNDVPDYWREEASALVEAGVIKGDGINPFGLRRETLKALIICKRYVDRVLR